MSEPIRFFLPGPVYVLEETRRAMTRPMRRAPLGRVPRRLGRRSRRTLPPLFRTRRPAMVATGSSTLVMEAALVSLVERDVLHLVNGAFSRALAGDRRALGREPDEIAVPWGEALDPDLAARRAAPQALRGGGAGAQRDLDRRRLAARRDRARGARGERRAAARRRGLLARRRAGRDRRLGARPRARRHAEGDRRAAGARRLHLLGARRGARRARRAARLLHRPAALPRQAARGRADHHAGDPASSSRSTRQLARIAAEGMETRWARHAALARRTDGVGARGGRGVRLRRPRRARRR